jgi:hypothetical protein
MSQSQPLTRSKSAAAAQNPNQKPQTEPSIGKTEQAKYIDARKSLNNFGFLSDSDTCNSGTLAITITTIMKAFPQTSVPPGLKKALANLAIVVSNTQMQCQSCEKLASIPDMIDELRIDIQTGLDAKLERLSRTLEDKLTAPQIDTPGTSDKLAETAKNLSELAAGLEAKINKVTNTTSQLANTATTYREVILGGNPHGHEHGGARNADPAINAATNRKVRQVMVQLTEGEAAVLSQQTIMEMATDAIKQIENPPSPEGIAITEVIKLRKGAILLLFNSREAADWLQHPEVEIEFTERFVPGCMIKPRQFAILAPRIPLTFEPGNANHLREIEEANRLGKNSIAKARWIKPANRRKADQLVAHATIIFNTAKDANRCISEGLLICGTKVSPSKLKQEPTQCMKCRKWGHFASECGESKDTCGTCGGEHRTNACTVSNKRYCVSCNANSHASWDRDCPVAERRRSWYNEKHPDNLLKYFPTEDIWTQEVSPDRIPIPERFPVRYAVGSLPPPNTTGRDQPTRIINHRQGKQRSHAYRTTAQTQEVGHPTPSQRTSGTPGREEGEISQFHTPNQTPDRPESWTDISSMDFNDRQI